MAKVHPTVDSDGHNVELRIVLVGKTGNGKSTLGNILLKKPDIMGEQQTDQGEDTDDKGFVVHTTMGSGTVVCDYQENVHAWDRHLKVVDTPGLFDTSEELEKTLLELTNVIYLSAPGPHAVIFVTRCDIRFTSEEYNAFMKIVEAFGEGVKHFLLLVFTRGEHLENCTIEDVLERNPPQRLRDVLKIVGKNYTVISKTPNEELREKEVKDLMDKINHVSQCGKNYLSTEEGEAMAKILNEDIEIKRNEKGLGRREAEYVVKRSMVKNRDGFLLSKKKMQLKILESKAFAVVADLEQEVSSSKVVLPEAANITRELCSRIKEVKKKVKKKEADESACTII